MKISAQNERRRNVFRILIGIYVAGLVVFSFLGLRRYVLTNHIYRGPVSEIMRLMPISVGYIEGVGRIPYRELVPLARYYEEKGASNPYRKAIVWIANVDIIEDLAEEAGIEPTRREIRDLANELPDEFRGRALRRSLIAEPWLAYQSIREVGIADAGLYDAGWQRVNELYELVVEVGMNFTNIARLNSELESASNGGYIGFVSRDDLDEVWHDFFDSDEEFSEILELDNAYVFARVYRESSGEDGKLLKEMRVIGVYKRGLDAAIESHAQSRPVVIY